jgi:hypothetical protein
MAQEYDKIIKENLEKVVLQLISKTTNIEAIKGEVLYPELHYTIEREADFVEKSLPKIIKPWSSILNSRQLMISLLLTACLSMPA